MLDRVVRCDLMFKARAAFVQRGLVAALLMGLSLGALVGCSTYTGSAVSIKPNELKREAGWLAVDGVPLLKQARELDCGPTALAMVLSYWHAAAPQAVLNQRSYVIWRVCTASRHSSSPAHRKIWCTSFRMVGPRSLA
jgi:hypothetical protein